MGHVSTKCEHGVAVSECRCRDHGEVTTVPCPTTCGVRVLAEETMAELPFVNAEQDRMMRHQGPKARFRGHDPYREI